MYLFCSSKSHHNCFISKFYFHPKFCFFLPEAFFRLLLFGSFHLLQHRTYLVLERKIEKLFASTPSSSSIHSVEDADQLLSHYSLQTLTSDSAAALNNSDMRRSMTLDVVFENDHVGNVENELDEEIMKENEVTSTSDDEFFDAISESSINDENPDQRISPSGEYGYSFVFWLFLFCFSFFFCFFVFYFIFSFGQIFLRINCFKLSSF